MTDADEFEAFVRRYEDMVYATAVRLLGNAHEAEDVAQTAFLKALQHFDQLATSPSAGGWLKTVATNLSLNLLQRHRRRFRLFSELSIDGSSASEDAAIQALAVIPPFDFEHADDLKRLEQALMTLPDHQRVPLVLFHLDGVSCQDIAELLGVSLAKVKTDMHRGRLALRHQMVRPHEPR